MAENKKKLKSIKEIVASTNTVKNRESSSLSDKKFGSIMAYNKLIDATPGGTTIQISMMIKGLTDKINKKPVAAHRVLIAISGVNYEHYTATELVAKIRAEIPEYKDEKKYTFMDIVKLVQEQNIKFFKNKSILPTRTRTYVIIDDKISTDANMQVWCSCSDYFWTFQWYNVEKNVDIRGIKPPSYRYSKDSKVTRTTSSGREISMAGKEATGNTTPVRNPQRAFGMCKHLLLLLGMLMDEDIIDNKTSGTQGSDNPGTAYRLNMSRFKKMTHMSYKDFNDIVSKYVKDRKIMVKRRRYLATSSKGIGKVKPNFAQKNSGMFHKGKKKFKP